MTDKKPLGRINRILGISSEYPVTHIDPYDDIDTDVLTQEQFNHIFLSELDPDVKLPKAGRALAEWVLGLPESGLRSLLDDDPEDAAENDQEGLPLLPKVDLLPE